MFQFPPLAPWEGMHVLVVHFPIALLSFSPAMLIAAIIFRRWGRQFAAAAGFVLLAGTLTCHIAVLSGGAAEELAEELGIETDPAAYEVLEKHEETGEAVRNMFLVITLLYWGYLASTGLSTRKPTLGVDVAVLTLFVILTGIGAVALANAAHLGGELVHEHGILAPLSPQAAAASAEAGQATGEAGEATEESEAED